MTASRIQLAFGSARDQRVRLVFFGQCTVTAYIATLIPGMVVDEGDEATMVLSVFTGKGRRTKLVSHERQGSWLFRLFMTWFSRDAGRNG